MKKVCILALALVMCLSLTAPAFAAESDFDIEGWVLKKYTGPGGAVVIPDGVHIIYDGAFKGCSNLTSVTIPDTVFFIGAEAFWDCTSLTSVTIPKGVTSIKENTFWHCTSLTDVTIPNTVTEIGDRAFWNCASLTEVTIPDSVTTIRWQAFSGCTKLTSITIPNSVTDIESCAFLFCPKLTEVTIPSGVTNIGVGAFMGCYGLSEIQVDPDNQHYTSVDGVVFTRSMDSLVAYPAGKEGAYTVPDGVTAIDEGTFYFCSRLTNITIPNSVTSIGKGAFNLCYALASITLPKGLSSIEDRVFSGCENLTSVIIPNRVTSIGYWAFANCNNLASITIPSSVTSVKNFAFENCTSLTDVYYGGTEAQWNAIEIGISNDPLTSATIHFNAGVASPSNDNLTVNGTPVTPTAYKIDGANYFKLRDVAALLNGTPKQFNVDYDDAAKTVIITAGQGYEKQPTDLLGAPTSDQNAIPSNNTVRINGIETNLTVYKINNENYFKLRDLGIALDFNVGYTPGEGAFIENDRPYDPTN